MNNQFFIYCCVRVYAGHLCMLVLYYFIYVYVRRINQIRWQVIREAFMLITPENEWGSKFNAHMVIFVAYIIYNISTTYCYNTMMLQTSNARIWIQKKKKNTYGERPFLFFMTTNRWVHPSAYVTVIYNYIPSPPSAHFKIFSLFLAFFFFFFWPFYFQSIRTKITLEIN